MRRSPFLAVIAFTLAVAACGGGGGSEPQPAAAGGTSDAPAAAEPADAAPDSGLPDACDVVTPDEVAEVFGAVGDYGPSGYATGDGTDCEFTRAADGLAIDVTIQSTHDAYRPDMWVIGEIEPVPGLGDESYHENDGLSVKVAFTKGDNSASVFAYAGNEDKIVELAQLIAGRMP